MAWWVMHWALDLILGSIPSSGETFVFRIRRFQIPIEETFP